MDLKTFKKSIESMDSPNIPVGHWRSMNSFNQSKYLVTEPSRNWLINYPGEHYRYSDLYKNFMKISRKNATLCRIFPSEEPRNEKMQE